MSVLDRSALEASPLSDLHAIASELGLDGFRRLRREALIDAILARQGEEADGAEEGDDLAEEDGADDEPAVEPEEVAERPAETEREPRRRPRRGRGRRGEAAEAAEAEPEPERTVEGVVELLANGSGFVRVSPPDPSDDDVYISAAQVRRCELVSRDTISGPVRPPRRSERFPSLVRVETINGAPADEVAEGTRYEELPAAFPSSRFALASEDPTLKTIEWLTPFGRGSRVTLAGPARSGKTEALRRLADPLAATEGVEVFLVLAGARPEEVAEWSSGPVPLTANTLLGTSADTQEHTIEAVVEQGRRLAARGGDAVVLIDSLDGLSRDAARRVMAAARNIADGGSLTVIATATEPLGGETTVIAFDARMTGARRFPAIDVATSGTMRPELLVGDAGAESIARARAEVYG
jgi:transcription termination factor Rho